MHGIRTRHGIAGLLSLMVITLTLTFGVIVDGHASPRSVVAANGTTVSTPSPTATGATASVKAGTGGGARWGFLLAIFAAIAIFVVGGLFVTMRARGDYLAEQARKAVMPQDEDA